MEWKQITLFEQTHHLIINRIFLNSRVKQFPLCRHEPHNEFIQHFNVLTVNARIYTLSRAHETRMQKTFLPCLILFRGCSVSKKSIEPLKSTPEMGIPFLCTLMDTGHVQFSHELFVNLDISFETI